MLSFLHVSLEQLVLRCARFKNGGKQSFIYPGTQSQLQMLPLCLMAILKKQLSRS